MKGDYEFPLGYKGDDERIKSKGWEGIPHATGGTKHLQPHLFFGSVVCMCVCVCVSMLK